MTEQLQSAHITRSRQGSTLPKVLAGDFSAAAISATLISPVITAIDRAVVENAAYSNRSLHTLLKSYILCSFRHPRLFFNAKPFFYIWTLYAATYSTANAVESIGDAVTGGEDKIMLSSITFLSTCIVNVPLGVWKDVRFVQTYGRYAAPTAAVHTPTMKSGVSTPPIQRPKFPKIVGATFLFRDAITIFGSFTLPSALATSLPNSFLTNPAAKMAAAQLIAPVLSQVLVTPVHLLGLDLYSNPRMTGAMVGSGERSDRLGERWSRIRRNLGPATVLRCVRIVPAFGVGGIVNTALRGCFNGKVEKAVDG